MIGSGKPRTTLVSSVAVVALAIASAFTTLRMLYIARAFSRYDLIEVPLALGLAQTLPALLLIGIVPSFSSTYCYVSRPVAITIGIITGALLASLLVLRIRVFDLIGMSNDGIFFCMVGYPLAVFMGRSIGESVDDHLADHMPSNVRWQNFSIRTIGLFTVAFACLVYLFFTDLDGASILLWVAYFVAWVVAFASYAFDVRRDRLSFAIGGSAGAILGSLFFFWFWNPY